MAGPSASSLPNLGSRRLLIAIVRRAVLDFALYNDCSPGEEGYELAVDAAGWLFWDGTEATDEEGRYTFLHICSLLDLDPQRVREKALTLTREEVRRLSAGGG